MKKVLAYLCLYEAAADTVNNALGEALLPSIMSGFERFSWKQTLLRPPPKWVGPVVFGALGLVAGALGRSRP